MALYASPKRHELRLTHANHFLFKLYFIYILKNSITLTSHDDDDDDDDDDNNNNNNNKIQNEMTKESGI